MMDIFNKNRPAMILYNLVITGGILLLPLLMPLVVLSRKRRKTILKRLGFLPRLNGSRFQEKGFRENKPIWIHALSVGETLSAVPLVKGIQQTLLERHFVFSSTTLTGHTIAKQRLNQWIDHFFYFPFDFPFAVKSVARRISPSMIIIVETDLWPNFLDLMEKTGVPVALVNARLSDRSFRGYRRFAAISNRMFDSLAVICVQSKEDKRRFMELGVPSPKIVISGNLKFDIMEETDSQNDLRALKNRLGLKPQDKLIVAGSTHSGEEAVLISVFIEIKKDIANLRMIIVPRNPDRAESICRTALRQGVKAITGTKLKSSEPDKPVDILVIDSLGLLKPVYQWADLVFIGGSLVNEGGHNPLEPAYFSKPVIFGPDMSDFRDAANWLTEAGGAVRIADRKDLVAQFLHLLTSAEEREKMGQHARAVVISHQGAVCKTVNALSGCLKSHESNR